LTTIASLLSDSVEAILIKGAPGVGKTTFALELLREAGEGVYISTRVSRQKLLGQIPGVKELIIVTDKTTNHGGSVEMGDMRLATPGDVLRQVIETSKQAHKKQLFVLDSWDGIAKEIANVERLKMEKTLLVISEAHNTKLVFISEEPEQTTLSYLVDAVIELKMGLHDGAIARTLEIQKLRGNPILRPKSLFTLKGSRFTEFTPDRQNPQVGPKKEDFKPIKHYDHFYSSGLKDVDEGFAGGFKKGSVALLEFGANLNPAVHYGLFNIFSSNFILNGGTALRIPGGGGSYQEIVDLALLSMPTEAVSGGLAVGVFEKYEGPCFFQLPPTPIQDCFDALWTKIASLKGRSNRPLIGIVGIDMLESIFDQRELLYYLSRTLQLFRRNQDTIGITCGNSSTLRQRLSDLSDIHVKYEIINDSLTVHSLNPPGPIMQISYDYSRGYPYPSFTPVN